VKSDEASTKSAAENKATSEASAVPASEAAAMPLTGGGRGRRHRQGRRYRDNRLGNRVTHFASPRTSARCKRVAESTLRRAMRYRLESQQFRAPFSSVASSSHPRDQRFEGFDSSQPGRGLSRARLILGNSHPPSVSHASKSNRAEGRRMLKRPILRERDDAPRRPWQTMPLSRRSCVCS
jgi:hypothetical protein